MGITRVHGLIGLKMIGVLVLSVPLIFAASGAAQAQDGTNYRVSYNVTWNFNSSPLHSCIRFRATGNMTYTFGTAGRSWQWWNIRLNSPVLTAYVYPAGHCGSTGSSKLNRIVMAQYWTGYACSFNPSLAVSFPWGIAFGAWPSCGDRSQAEYQTDYSVTSSNYHQNNTGSPTQFTYYTNNQSPKDYPCYGVYVSGTGYIGVTSDSYGASSGSGSRAVCLSKGS